MLIITYTLDDPVKEQILTDSCALYNKKQAMVDPAHVDVTPQEHLLDYLTRYIEGLQGPILQEAEIASRLAEIKATANRANDIRMRRLLANP